MKEKEKMTQWKYYVGNFGPVTAGMLFLGFLTIALELYRGSSDWYFGLVFIFMAVVVIPVGHVITWRNKKHLFK